MGFQLYRREDGWATVRGPSGAAGHAVTSGGEDGLFYNVRTGELHIVDNKSYARAGNVGSATAIDPSRNLLQNLDTMIGDVDSRSSRDLPMRQDVLRRLRQTRAVVAQALATNSSLRLPARVSLIVSNVGGRSTGVSQALAAASVRLVDQAQPIPPRAGTAVPSLAGGPRPTESGPSPVLRPPAANRAATPPAPVPTQAAGPNATAPIASAPTAGTQATTVSQQPGRTSPTGTLPPSVSTGRPLALPAGPSAGFVARQNRVGAVAGAVEAVSGALSGWALGVASRRAVRERWSAIEATRGSAPDHWIVIWLRGYRGLAGPAVLGAYVYHGATSEQALASLRSPQIMQGAPAGTTEWSTLRWIAPHEALEPIQAQYE